MSRRGNCHDNAVAESFFKLLKRERIIPSPVDYHPAEHRRNATRKGLRYLCGSKNCRHGSLHGMLEDRDRQAI